MSLPLRYSLLLPVAVVAACNAGKPSDDTDTDASTDDTDVSTDDTDDTDAPTDDTDVADTDDTDVADTDDTDAEPTTLCGDAVPEPGELCFGAPVGIDAEGVVTALAIGLWDGEGVDVVLGATDEIRWADGDGAGGFRSDTQVKYDESLDTITDIDLGYLDSDANLDILYGSSNSSPKILFGTGGGGVTKEVFTNVGEGYASDVLVVDLVGTAAVDDLVWFGECSGVAVNDGSQNDFHTQSNAYLLCGDGPPYVSLGTLAHHQADKIGVVLVADTVLTLFPLTFDGEGLNTEATSTVTLDAAAVRVLAGDLDGDGDEDVVVLDASGDLAVLFADGAGGWEDQGGSDFATVTVGTSASDAVLADIDADGDPDVLATLPDDDKVAVLINDGSGTFTADEILLVVGAAPSRIAAGDLNADGLPDLAIATVADDDVTVLFSAP